MSRLDRAWWACRALGRPDRARFLTMLREAYARERQDVRRAHGGVDLGARMSSLRDLALT